MKSITEPVVISSIIGNKAPAWTVGQIGSFNPTLYYIDVCIDVCNPETDMHRVFDAGAFTFNPARPGDKPHVLRIIEAQREWEYDERALPDWQLQEALMFPNKDPRKA